MEHAARLEETPNVPSFAADLRILFATILTDPGSSLAYGADALVAVTVALVAVNYQLGALATVVAAALVMGVYLVAVIVYNNMTMHHTHPKLGGGAFVSALITSNQIRRHPFLKKAVHLFGKLGSASLLSDFPATQAISLIAGVEALYFIPVANRLAWVVGFLIFLSVVQRYGLGSLSRFMIWPVIGFYSLNLVINAFGVVEILDQGWRPPTIPEIKSAGELRILPIVMLAVANGATLITGVEVGYSSVNIPHHRGRAIRASMWFLYIIVLLTYSMQIINFLGLGVAYDPHIPVPIQIASHLGGDTVAVPFGILTAVMLLLAAQTAQSDFPLEILRTSRSNFFPRAIGDMAWRKTTPALGIGGHDGVYNPRATMLLAGLSFVIIYFFPTSHDIESMYGLAVVTALNIGIFSYLLRQIRARRVSVMTVVGAIIMIIMLGNILYNKFFEGAWFIVVLMVLYMLLFIVSERIYSVWQDKLNVAPVEFCLWFPAFQNLAVDRKNVIFVSRFHAGTIHFLKNYIKSGHIPLVVHFQTDPEDDVPAEHPDWFENVIVPEGTNTVVAMAEWVRVRRPQRVHLIPILVRGLGPFTRYFFGNSMEALKLALSEHADVQVEYNKERLVITVADILRSFLPFNVGSKSRSKGVDSVLHRAH